MYYAGIDPGASGAIVCINGEGGIIEQQSHASLSFPWKEQGRFLLRLKELKCLLVMEKVHAFRGQGVSSMFSFGQNYGGWLALLDCSEVPYILVPPQTWQKKILGPFAKGQAKATAFKYITRRYPQLNFSKSKDEGVIDALCMALYAKENK